MSDIPIKVNNLSKRYRIGLKEELHDTFIGSMLEWFKSPYSNYKKVRSLTTFSNNDESDDIIWALKDVSFEVKKGEVLGIIGKNGAGKSTLLKILCRITGPTNGRISINGRVASLLEVGTGFHPELSGRENIYLNGTILGMTRSEIDTKFDQILDFSGVEEFIDTPVKRYSSGMKVRLAFSVAAHLEPEILLIDEVLSVGDLEFQRKCLGKMEDVSQSGRTVLFVSHNLDSVLNLCGRAILLENGQIVSMGKTEKIVNQYIQQGYETMSIKKIAERTDRRGDGQIRFTSIRLVDDNGRKVEYIRTGDTFSFLIGYESRNDQPLKHVSIRILIADEMDRFITHFWSKFTGQDFKEIPSKGSFVCKATRFALMPGEYGIAIKAFVKGDLSDKINFASKLTVKTGDFFNIKRADDYKGLFVSDQEWDLEWT
tara:strand:- start:6341 stop:7624 length:1284 start_codon:yes stop_codon:yes gene_type:complete